MEETTVDNGEIVRLYGDINVVVDPVDYLGFVQRVSTGEGIVFHLEADFYTEWPGESGFSKWKNEDSWRLQYTNEAGEVTNQIDLTFDEYEKVNRFFMKFRSGTL